jgi:hypothetical protein
MRRLILSILVIVLVLLIACAAPSAPPPPAPKITLAHAPQVLDLSQLLPASFERLDAVSEGHSHKDLGLSKYASEVELFASTEPPQIIYCYFAIYENPTMQKDVDALMKDEQQMKFMWEENIKALAINRGLEVAVPKIEIAYHDIGDLAVSTEGVIALSDSNYNFDTLHFKNGKVYVFIYSLSFGPDKVSLIPIGREIEQRIAQFSQ